MPSASLMMMANPLLMGPLVAGPAPVNAAMEMSAVAPIEVATRIEASQPWQRQTPDILALNWSLTQSQEGEGPPDESGTAPDAGEGEGASDQNRIVVEGEYGPSESDPIAEFNEESYRITQDLDEVFLEPVAYAYRDGLPDPLRDGLGNVVRNLSEPTNFINYLLQFKFGKALETLGRFAINSSLGLGGLIDVAGKPGINLPYRRNGFANTLGFYGVEPGAYLYLPLTGATTVRDLIGNGFNQLPLPVLVGKPFNTPAYTIPFFVISSLDERLEVDAELGRIDNMIDPYAARRDSYLWSREREIALLKGEEVPPKPEIVQEVDGELDLDMLDEEEFDESEVEDNPATQPSDAPAIMSQTTTDAASVDAAQVAITAPRTR